MRALEKIILPVRPAHLQDPEDQLVIHVSQRNGGVHGDTSALALLKSHVGRRSAQWNTSA